MIAAPLSARADYRDAVAYAYADADADALGANPTIGARQANGGIDLRLVLEAEQVKKKARLWSGPWQYCWLLCLSSMTR